jgi:ribA/ribD-fused uncharacterized protein
VMEFNQKLMDLDARRNAARSAVREVVLYPNPTVRDVDKSQPKEDRKMGFGVYGIRLYPFKLEHEYGQYVPDEEAPAAAEEDAGPAPEADLSVHQPLKDGRLARIFFDPAATEINGFLSPLWPVEFTLDGTRYFTALQAYEAERAKELGEAALRETILKTRSSRTIRILVKKIAGKHPKDPKGLWLRILTAAFQQHEVLKQQLLATGTDALVYADLQAGPSGVGLAKEDRAILDPAKWKGENAVGVALETLRTRLREGSAEEAPEEDDAEGVITEEEQQKAKVGAIINARRNGAA